MVDKKTNCTTPDKKIIQFFSLFYPNAVILVSSNIGKAVLWLVTEIQKLITSYLISIHAIKIGLLLNFTSVLIYEWIQLNVLHDHTFHSVDEVNAALLHQCGLSVKQHRIIQVIQFYLILKKVFQPQGLTLSDTTLVKPCELQGQIYGLTWTGTGPPTSTAGPHNQMHENYFWDVLSSQLDR